MAGLTQPSLAQVLPPFQFLAPQTGFQEVPPVPSPGSAISRLGFDPTLTLLRVLLIASNLRQTTVAHIHLGRPGENGPVVMFLFQAGSPVDIDGPTVLTNSIFTAANLTGPLRGQPLSVLAQQMLLGNTYANVHTIPHPDGEVRGQVVPGG